MALAARDREAGSREFLPQARDDRLDHLFRVFRLLAVEIEHFDQRALEHDASLGPRQGAEHDSLLAAEPQGRINDVVTGDEPREARDLGLELFKPDANGARRGSCFHGDGLSRSRCLSPA